MSRPHPFRKCRTCGLRAVVDGFRICSCCMDERSRRARLHALIATPKDRDDPKHWAILFTRARLRKGWTYQRLSLEAEVGRDTVINACLRGECKGQTILKLAHALDLIVIPPLPTILTAQQAQYGR